MQGISASNSLSELFTEAAAARARFFELLGAIERETGVREVCAHALAEEFDTRFPGGHAFDSHEAQALLARTTVGGPRLVR